MRCGRELGWDGSCTRIGKEEWARAPVNQDDTRPILIRTSSSLLLLLAAAVAACWFRRSWSRHRQSFMREVLIPLASRWSLLGCDD